MIYRNIYLILILLFVLAILFAGCETTREKNTTHESITMAPIIGLFF